QTRTFRSLACRTYVRAAMRPRSCTRADGPLGKSGTPGLHRLIQGNGMLQRTILVIAIFFAILVALTFGDALLSQVYAWISRLTGWLVHNFSDLYAGIAYYLS